MAVMRMREALRDAMAEEMRRDDNVLVMGEDVGVFQGSFKVTEGLLDEFGEKHAGDILFRNWEDLIAQLSERLPRRARVAVFPFASIQVPAPGST